MIGPAAFFKYNAGVTKSFTGERGVMERSMLWVGSIRTN
jgi:hypothetical protein